MGGQNFQRKVRIYPERWGVQTENNNDKQTSVGGLWVYSGTPIQIPVVNCSGGKRRQVLGPVLSKRGALAKLVQTPLQ